MPRLCGTPARKSAASACLERQAPHGNRSLSLASERFRERMKARIVCDALTQSVETRLRERTTARHLCVADRVDRVHSTIGPACGRCPLPVVTLPPMLGEQVLAMF